MPARVLKRSLYPPRESTRESYLPVIGGCSYDGWWSRTSWQDDGGADGCGKAVQLETTQLSGTQPRPKNKVMERSKLGCRGWYHEYCGADTHEFFCYGFHATDWTFTQRERDGAK